MMQAILYSKRNAQGNIDTFIKHIPLWVCGENRYITLRITNETLYTRYQLQ